MRVTAATSHHPERDAVILLLGHCCGLRISETAQLTIDDIMFASGKLRTEALLRAAITKGCRQRTTYISSPKLITAIECYIAFRNKLPLVLKRTGYPYELNTKRRTLDSGERRDYLAADSLQSYNGLLNQATEGRK